MMRLEYRVMPGIWITVQDELPDDGYAETWAKWVWTTKVPIRLVDVDSGLAVREHHPSTARK